MIVEAQWDCSQALEIDVMVQDGQISDFARQIRQRFPVQRVILFGSHASGSATADSDVDLLIVMPFEGDRVDQSVAIRMELRPPFPVDLIIRSPNEVRERLTMGDSFIRDILEHGKVLYEAPDG